MIRSPLGENARPRTKRGQASGMARRSAPLATSETRTTLSQPAHASDLPSADQSTPHMPGFGSPSVPAGLTAATSHRRTQQASLALLTDASRAPSGEKTRPTTSPE